ncbi:hypothetical protein PIB30_029501, partial [Stylosanthes scabra]|nr:hypothetical protein [Stylosanthes scabra]
MGDVEKVPDLVEFTAKSSVVENEGQTKSPSKSTSKPTLKPTNSQSNVTSIKHAKPSAKTTKTSKKPPPPKPTRRSTRFIRRSSIGSASKAVEDPITLEDDTNSDSYDSVEDSLYRPAPEDSSSDDVDIVSGVSASKRKDDRFRNDPQYARDKEKEKIMREDDGLVVENSDEDIDWDQVMGNFEVNHGSYDAYDPLADDSDGKDSWESLEMKTPPNSED